MLFIDNISYVYLLLKTEIDATNTIVMVVTRLSAVVKDHTSVLCQKRSVSTTSGSMQMQIISQYSQITLLKNTVPCFTAQIDSRLTTPMQQHLDHRTLWQKNGNSISCWLAGFMRYLRDELQSVLNDEINCQLFGRSP